MHVKRVLPLAVTVFFCAAKSILALGVAADRQKVEDVFSQFLYHISQGESEEAYDLLSDASKSAYEVGDFSTWRALVQSTLELGEYTVWFRTEPRDYRKPLRNYRIADVTYPRVYIASVTMRLADTESGFSFEQIIDRFVVKEGGAWKLLLRTSGIDGLIAAYGGNERSRLAEASLSDDNRRISADDISSFDRGLLQEVKGIPFLRLHGNYYEMGLQYGTLLPAWLKDAYEAMEEILSPLRSAMTPSLRMTMTDLLGQRYIDQLRGMAEGSGIDFEYFLAAAWYGELRRRENCTSVLVDTPSGILHGRNLDDVAYSADYPLIIEYNPVGGRRCLVLGVIGDVGISEGLNADGITVSGNGAPGGMRNTELLGMPYALVRRQVLESATTIAEAEQILGQHEASTGTILLVGSCKERDGILSEHVYDRRHSVAMGSNGALYATNDYSGDSMPGPRAVETCGRYGQIEDFLATNSVQSVDDMIFLLSLPSEPFGVNNRNTVHSVVLDPAAARVYFANAPDHAAISDWYVYDWASDTWSVHRLTRLQEPYL